MKTKCITIFFILFSLFTNAQTTNKSELKLLSLKKIDSLSVLINANSQDDSLYEARSFYKSLAGDYIGALEDINKAIEIGSGTSKMYSERAHYKTILNDYKGAIKDCDIAISKNSNSGYAYQWKGRANYLLGNYKSSAEDLTKAVLIYSARVDTTYSKIEISVINFQREFCYINLGNAYYSLNDFSAALNAYENAFQLNPKIKSNDFYRMRGQCYVNLKKYVKALPDFNMAIELNSKDTNAYVGRANTKLILGDNRGAIDDCSAAIGLGCKSFLCYHISGEAKSYLNKHSEAIEDLTQAIKRNPKYAQSYYLRGLSKLMLKDKEGGCRDLSKAGELGQADAYIKINSFCQ